MTVNKIVTVDAVVLGCAIVVVNARAPIVALAKALAIAIVAVASDCRSSHKSDEPKRGPKSSLLFLCQNK